MGRIFRPVDFGFAERRLLRKWQAPFLCGGAECCVPFFEMG